MVDVEYMINEYMDTIGYLESDFDVSGGIIYKHKETGKRVMVLVEDLD